MDAHDEIHADAQLSKLNWLRAAVLGANDGIVSVAALVVGVAGATSEGGTIFITGIAGLMSGALSMAVGEYVSVSSQRDVEEGLLRLFRLPHRLLGPLLAWRRVTWASAKRVFRVPLAVAATLKEGMAIKLADRDISGRLIASFFSNVERRACRLYDGFVACCEVGQHLVLGRHTGVALDARLGGN